MKVISFFFMVNVLRAFNFLGSLVETFTVQDVKTGQIEAKEIFYS